MTHSNSRHHKLPSDIAHGDALLADVEVYVAEADERIDKTALPFSINRPHTQHYFSESQGIILGPVVGLVTATSVRILIETNISANVICSLRGQNRTMRNIHMPRSKSMNVEAGTPVVFEFKDLAPDHRYNIKFNLPYFDLVHSSFRTIPDHSDPEQNPIKFAVVSGNEVVVYDEKPYPSACDNLKVRKSTHATDESLWKDLYQRILDEKIHYVIHIGNNVDIGFPSVDTHRAYSLFKELSLSDASERSAVNAIQSRYRQIWNESWTKHVLANASNIMLLNESDIGKLVELVSESTGDSDARVANAAFSCYQMYQQALVHKPSVSAGPKLLTHMISLTHHLKLLMIDWRTMPTQNSSGVRAAPELIGSSGFATITKGLNKASNRTAADEADVNYKKSCQVLVLSSLQICDRDSYIHSPQFSGETNRLLQHLFKWKENGPIATREVLIISGASRSAGLVGGLADITNRRTGDVIKEWIVGPISAPPINRVRANSFASPNFNFRLSESYWGNNYAVITTGMRFRSTTNKEDADIPQSYLVCSPHSWVEYYFTAPTTTIKDHALAEGTNKSLLPPTVTSSVATHI